METINLADQLDERELNAISQECMEAFKADLESREEWEEQQAKWKKLYYQKDEPSDKVNDAFDRSRASIPLLTEGVNLFQARAYKAFFPTRDFVQAAPVGGSTQEAVQAAERVAKHINSQLTVDNPSYRKDKGAMLLASAISGSDFSKVYYDPLKAKVCVKRVRAEDLVIPYGVGQRQIEDIERKSEIVWLTRNQARYLVKSSYFIREPEVYQEGYSGTIKETVDKIQGLAEQSYIVGQNKPCCIIEQHTMLDIDGDGLAEPYIVHLDKQSWRVLRISVRYDTDEHGEATEYKEPLEYYTHYGFLPNPDGFYSLGFGHLLGSLNEACNKMLRETLDSAELANVGNMSGFISERLGVKGGDLGMKLGKLRKVPKSVDDIASSIKLLEFPGPTPAYVQMLQFLIPIAQRLSSSTDAATGDIQKVMQPLTIMTMLESSLQLPTSVMEQMAISFESEFGKIYRLNQKYLKQPVPIEDEAESGLIMPDDYAFKQRVYPIIDPKMITKQQKIAKAQALYDFTMQNPLLSQNPGAIMEATKRMLDAMEVEEVETFFPEMPAPQRIDDQTQENYLFMQPDNQVQFDVFPDQNHAEHIAVIEEFLRTPEFQGLPPEIQQQVLEHRQKHIAYDYGLQNGVVDGQGQLVDMASERDNQMGLEGIMGGIPAGGGDMGLYSGQGGEGQGAAGGFAPPEASTGATEGLLGLASLGLDIPQR